MKLERKLLLIIGLILEITATVYATKILYEKSPEFEIKTIPMCESLWRGSVMIYPQKVSRDDIVWTGKDFFRSEYGKPCVFNEDWIKKYGFSGGAKYKIESGNLEFTTGKKGFYFGFGGIQRDRNRDSIRFGANWGPNTKDNFRLVMEVEQNVEKTDWTFSGNDFFRASRHPKNFTIRGKGTQKFVANIGYVRNISVSMATGIKFFCKTPGCTVKIKSIKIAPYSKEVFFRKTFTLKNKPVMAHMTFDSPETYELYVNGKLVSKGSNIYPCGFVKTVSLLPFLKKGKNVIAYKEEYYRWSSGKPAWFVEAIAVDRNGGTTRIFGDKSWKCAIKAGKDWMKSSCNVANWVHPRLSKTIMGIPLATGKLVFNGIDPRHMGMLLTAPKGQKYPVFDGKKPIAFTLKLPVGVKNKFQPILKVFKANTKLMVEEIKNITPETKKDLLVYDFAIKTKITGPYRLEWLLVDNTGKTVEKRRDELIIIGKIKQEQLSLADFEKKFEKRLKLVRHIDCSKVAGDNTEFIDHSGMYGTNEINKGKVVNKNGMSYRVTGKKTFDYFAYRLHLKERGKPYMIEVVIPDDADRYIYSGVAEHYSIAFCNNPTNGSRGRFCSTATAITGVNKPLSNKKRKIRYVYWPGSLASAVVVMSGKDNIPAAACEINIYKIQGGLPALKIPKTTRMFGTHNERLSVLNSTLGISENPIMTTGNYRKNGRRNGWYQWYVALERKIKWLRFQGRNMTVEGIYMYSKGALPSLKHNKEISNQELDAPLLAINMYNANNIKCMLGFEYIASPMQSVAGLDNISDRKVRKGIKGIHLIDRYGRQLITRNGGGGNFLDPRCENIILDLVKEIYRRYSNVGKVDGLFWIMGQWWTPGFIRGTFRDIENTEVGYGDLTASLFEKETGINLNINAKAPDRFQQRYDKLMGKYKSVWFKWRALKIKQFFEKVKKTISTAQCKWPLYVFPSVGFEAENPFNSHKATPVERGQYFAKRYTDAGLPLAIYKDTKDITIVPNLKTFSKFRNSDDFLHIYGWNKSASAKKIINDANAMYFIVAKGLDEVDCPANKASQWIWSHTGRGNFVPKWIGDNCMWEVVDVLAQSIPKVIFYHWQDCNMATGFGPQTRRFCKSFYATPDVKFKRLSQIAAKGVIAEVGAGKYLRLVNNTPYISVGRVSANVKKMRDLVYDRDIVNGKVVLKPYDIRIIALHKLAGKVKCSFKLSKSGRKNILAKCQYILDNQQKYKKVPRDMIAKLVKAQKYDDAFTIYNILNNYEVAFNIKGAEKDRVFLKNQDKLLADLKKDKGRIICASTADYIDPDGKRWLKDQTYSACGAYGNKYASFADRGNMAIANTKLDRVYQTEAYGKNIYYYIPVPNGTYNVYLHFAETYYKNKAPGRRLFSARIQGRRLRGKIDIFDRSGGFAKPLIINKKGVKIRNGLLTIQFIGGVCINGIEIEKVKK